MAALMLASFFAFADRNIFFLLMPAIEKALSISDTRLSLLAGAAFAVFYSVMAIPFGWAADRVNRRNLIVAGVFCWSVATVLCGLARTYDELFLARISVGVGEATLIPTAISMIGDSFPFESRGRVIGLFTASIMLGSGLAQVVGGYVLRLLHGAGTVHVPVFGHLQVWQAAFVAVGLPGFLVALFLLSVSEPRRAKLPTSAASSDTPTTPSNLTGHVRAHKNAYALTLAAYTTFSFVSFAIVPWSPTLFVRNYGLTAADAGMLLGVATLLGGVPGTVTGGMLGDYWGRAGRVGARFRLTIFWSLTVIPATIGITMFGVRMAAFSWFVMFFIQSMCYASGTAVMQDMTPPRFRGRAVSVWYLVTGVGGYSLGPTATALVTDSVFHRPLMLPYSILVVTVFGAALTLPLAWYGLRPFQRARDAVKLGESTLSRT